MKRLVTFALPFLIVLSVRADILGHAVEINPAAGWKSVDPREPGQAKVAAPTVKFVPKDGHRAALLVSLLPAQGPGFDVTDLASLRQFNLVSATPYLPTPDSKPTATEFTVARGLGVYVVNEDPALVGKPTPPNEYRTATTASILLGTQFVLHCTIFHEKIDSADFRQALQMLSSVRLMPGDKDRVSRPGLSAVLHLPPKRFEPSDMGLNRDPGYFIFSDRNGVMLSGWLDRAEKFKDMESFWAKEKAHLVNDGGFTVTEESTRTINGWSAIFYSVVAGKLSQKNVRACRVVGDTWVDVHLSKSNTDATWKDLEDVMNGLSLTTH